MMTRSHILAVSAAALMVMAPDAMAQRRGGAVSGGVRGAVVGGIVGGSDAAKTGAKIGVVTGATRAAVDREAQRRAEYQATPAYQTAPRSNFNTAPPQVLATTPQAAATPTPTPTPAPTAPRGEAVISKDGKPVIGVTFPADWKQVIGDHNVSAASPDGQAYSMVATVEGVADKQAAIAKVKQGLEQYLQDVKYDDMSESERGALVVTGTGKAKKSGVDVVFAIGVLDIGGGKTGGAAFVVDSRIEDHYKDTILSICETIRFGDQLAEKK
jgi:hypothetical protein